MDSIFCLESFDEFEKVLREAMDNMCHSGTPSNIQKKIDVRAAHKDIENIILSSNFEINKIPDLLVDKGWDSDKISFYVTLLNEKRTEILYSYLVNHNSTYGEVINHFDWFLKFVFGTSELNTLRYPVLQLLFSTVDHNSIQNKVMYDINKDSVLKLINLLEKIDL